MLYLISLLPLLQKKKKSKTLSVSTGVKPLGGFAPEKKKKISLLGESGMKRQTIMAIRHADGQSELLEVQWGLVYIGTSMSLGTLLRYICLTHGVRSQPLQKLESASSCTFILPWDTVICAIARFCFLNEILAANDCALLVFYWLVTLRLLAVEVSPTSAICRNSMLIPHLQVLTIISRGRF